MDIVYMPELEYSSYLYILIIFYERFDSPSIAMLVHVLIYRAFFKGPAQYFKQRILQRCMYVRNTNMYKNFGGNLFTRSTIIRLYNAVA